MKIILFPWISSFDRKNEDTPLAAFFKTIPHLQIISQTNISRLSIHFCKSRYEFIRLIQLAKEKEGINER